MASSRVDLLNWLAISIGIVMALLSVMITFGHRYAFQAFIKVITAAAA